MEKGSKRSQEKEQDALLHGQALGFMLWTLEDQEYPRQYIEELWVLYQQ